MKINKGKQSRSRRMLIYGEPGVGKSTLASQFPHPLFLNMEDGIGDIECDSTDRITTYDEFMHLVTAEIPQTDYATIVVDTADWLEKILSERVASANKKKTIEDIGFGKGYESLEREWHIVFSALGYLWKQGRHIVLTCHEETGKFKDPEGDAYDYYRPALHKIGSACVVEWCDEVLFCKHRRFASKVDGDKRTISRRGERMIVCNNMLMIEAKNRLGMPDDIPMEIASFYPYLTKNEIKPSGSVVASVVDPASEIQFGE
jgi:hypothetical protein